MECYLSSLQKTELCESTWYFLDMKMINAPKEGPTTEQGRDVEITDVFEEKEISKEEGNLQ